MKTKEAIDILYDAITSKCRNRTITDDDECCYGCFRLNSPCLEIEALDTLLLAMREAERVVKFALMAMRHQQSWGKSDAEILQIVKDTLERGESND